VPSGAVKAEVVDLDHTVGADGVPPGAWRSRTAPVRRGPLRLDSSTTVLRRIPARELAGPRPADGAPWVFTPRWEFRRCRPWSIRGGTSGCRGGKSSGRVRTVFGTRLQQPRFPQWPSGALADSQPTHLLREGAGEHPERRRRAALVTVGRVECGEDQRPLVVREHVLQPARLCGLPNVDSTTLVNHGCHEKNLGASRRDGN